MEKRRFSLRMENFIWVAGIIQFAMLPTYANVTTVQPQAQIDESVTSYSWSPWSSWSACSRTCGGGVSIQERHCLPRSRNTIPPGTLPPPVITVRIARQTKDEECSGVDKRYHQCNTAPCSSGARDIRAEQCSTYNYRPFRGRFYTWVPYIDGNSPCTLNCRPLGQQFYASLALVPDGASCTKPGFQAICVQGSCKVIGRESVLAVSGAREVHCGRRLVSGLFSRPRLPLGYSYVTTVPRGACRLNISEIVPSDNYIALKISNGSYIMNGEFAVSTPGTYEAAGARFLYSRAANRDIVFALGPLQHPIDIMILYTQPNPNIKYEYFTESLPGEIDIESITRGSLPDVHATPPPKHVHRHHTFDSYPRTGRIPNTVSISKEDNEDGLEENIVGSRRFIWKIMSYTQCSRSCGGGFQVGKYRCVETSDSKDKEVSSVHCSGSAPSGRRRRCGTIPCAPRWRSAVWSSCPVCGPAIRTRIVGCVQDHSRGIIKISDQKCPSLKPPTSEPCNIPNCDNTTSENSKHFETKRVIKSREHTDNFQDGPVYTVSVNTSETNLGPKYSFSSVPGWLFTDWSECVGWCVGGGIQTRHIRCADPSGCVPQTSPETLRSCTPKLTCDSHQGQWFTSEWSECSSACGGKQVRGVVCVGGGGRRLRDTACVLPRPQHQRDCNNSKHCAPVWHYSDWGQCAGNCSIGTAVQGRTVLCARVAVGNVGASVDGVASDDECKQARPHAHRTCSPNCIASASDNLPPDIPIESQKVSDTENATTNEEPAIEKHEEKDCEDKLSNCGLAVQARLCHYNYYVQNCCQSCHERL